MTKILFVIPAKSNSLRVKNKNIRKFGNSTLLGYKIKECLKTNLGPVIVSTNSKKIGNYSIKLGAKVPFLRPEKYSTSKSSMISCILNLVLYLKKKSIKYPQYIAVMPPTYPFTKSKSIKKAFKKLRSNKKFNSICSFTNCFDHPFQNVKNKEKLNFNVIKYEGYFLKNFDRTQDYPKAHSASSAIRISKTSYFLKYIKYFSPKITNNVIDFNSCLGFKITKREAFDINNYDDFNIAKFLIKNKKVWDT